MLKICFLDLQENILSSSFQDICNTEINFMENNNSRFAAGKNIQPL